jgi:hypothetical protein
MMMMNLQNKTQSEHTLLPRFWNLLIWLHDIRNKVIDKTVKQEEEIKSKQKKDHQSRR